MGILGRGGIRAKALAGKSKVLRELKDGDRRAERVRCLVPDHGGDLGRGHSAATPHLVLLP